MTIPLLIQWRMKYEPRTGVGRSAENSCRQTFRTGMVATWIKVGWGWCKKRCERSHSGSEPGEWLLSSCGDRYKAALCPSVVNFLDFKLCFLSFSQIYLIETPQYMKQRIQPVFLLFSLLSDMTKGKDQQAGESQVCGWWFTTWACSIQTQSALEMALLRDKDQGEVSISLQIMGKWLCLPI